MEAVRVKNEAEGREAAGDDLVVLCCCWEALCCRQEALCCRKALGSVVRDKLF